LFTLSIMNIDTDHPDTRTKLEAWRAGYNKEGLHSSLRTEFSREPFEAHEYETAGS